MLIKRPSDIRSSEITSESHYLSRRKFMQAFAGAAAVAAGGSVLSSCADAQSPALPRQAAAVPGRSLDFVAAQPVSSNNGFSTSEKLTPYEAVTSHNNFYEFGTDKRDPKRYAGELQTDPWSVAIDGEADNTGTFFLEDLLKNQPLEERIYRLRCVEAWSMVIPWVGFSLSSLIKRAQPNSSARYVVFETLYRPEQMRGQRGRFNTLDWPYVEGLTMAEAMHPLTMIATGLYGKSLPVQNGAPLRLVVPWKYGFKSIKSIVKIKFVKSRPSTSWNVSAPREYGFFANVNPTVDHPRWSQASERRLPTSLFNSKRIATLPFNGYAEQVANLYTGMDLKRYF